MLPVILYIHGAGWVFGNAHTHDRLVRELAVGTGAAVVFPEYSLSPEARTRSRSRRTTPSRSGSSARAPHRGSTRPGWSIAGDSVGGNMTAALTIMAKQRGDVTFLAQALLYPVTDASFDTAGYREFGAGYCLRREAMMLVLGSVHDRPSERAQRDHRGPLRATADDLAGLPKALVINGEADVLRDEGEAYARHLRAAGVDVTATRYGGAIHDFMMVNALRETNAAGAAIAQTTSFLKTALEG